MTTRTILLAAAVIGSACATSANAGADPTGVWIDHTGRGAVEITHCGAALCGHVVWLKSASHNDQCGRQIIGNAKPSGDTWEGGWIYSPDDDRRYSLELKPIGASKLQVMGYMGSKLFSETMTWKRATTELPRCDGARTAAAKPPAVAPRARDSAGAEVAAVAPPPPHVLPPALPPALGEPQPVSAPVAPLPPAATAPAVASPAQSAAIPAPAAPPPPVAAPDVPERAAPERAAPERARARAAPAADADDDSDSLELKRIHGRNGKADRCFVRLNSFKVQIPCL